MKVNMLRDEHSTRDRVEAAKAFGVGLIAKKDTRERAWCELVGRGSGHIGITQATKDVKIGIGWRIPE